MLGAYFADSDNYFHFWADTIGDIWFLKEMGVDLETLDHIFILHSQRTWQYEILAMCNVPLTKVVSLADFDLIECEQLVLPIRPKGGQVNPVWLARALRETSNWLPPRFSSRLRNIYISRLDTTRRKLKNENDVINFLIRLGFEIVECSKITVAEQRELFASASTVIAPHGAALTNIVWMHPKSTLIELLPKQHAYPCFYDLAKITGLNYIAIGCNQLNVTEDPLFADISVSLDEIKSILDDLGFSTRGQAPSATTIY
jgi:capsular polysaccharide biosynthesis protein